MKKKTDKRIGSDFMKGNNYAKKDWSINDTSSLLKNTHYKKFHTKKKRIQLKYDKRLFEWHTSRPPASIKVVFRRRTIPMERIPKRNNRFTFY